MSEKKYFNLSSRLRVQSVRCGYQGQLPRIIDLRSANCPAILTRNTYRSVGIYGTREEDRVGVTVTRVRGGLKVAKMYEYI